MQNFCPFPDCGEPVDLYVFLDVDGVLNSRDWYERRPPRPDPCTREQHSIHQIDPEAVARVNHLCAVSSAKVVVSSTWRGVMPRLLDGLRPYREFEIVDITPTLPGSMVRGLEIQKWMTKNDVEAHQVVILDDDSDMHHLMPRLVRTPHDTGIQDKHVEQALVLFGVKSK